MATQSFTRARLVVLAPLVALALAAAIIALVVVTTRDDSSPSAAAQPQRPTSAPATPVTQPVTVSPSAARTSLSTSPVAKNSPVASPAASSPAAAASPDKRPPLTYTVKRGDNLTVIARWFKLHGYGDLYDRNKKVIGSDPNFILPGQKITISGSGMVSR